MAGSGITVKASRSDSVSGINDIRPIVNDWLSQTVSGIAEITTAIEAVGVCYEKRGLPRLPGPVWFSLSGIAEHEVLAVKPALNH